MSLLFHHPRTAAVIISAVLAIAAASPSRACGGFFCSSFPMNQVSEQILFVANGETVTTHVQIEYNGTAADFAWILPVPAVPKLGVSHNELFRQLQFATQPFFVLDWREDPECGFGPPVFAAAEGADDATRRDVDVVSEGQVGPYQTAVISSEDAGAIVEWLEENGYELGDLGVELLTPYVEGDFLFLALKLAPDRDVGDLQPIALEYPSVEPMIPIQLTAVATEPDLGVLVWILGEERAIPKNYLHVRINEALIDWFNFGFNYQDVVTRAADEAGGQAFATDYAGASSIMENALYWEDRFDLDALRRQEHPVDVIDELLFQGFPRDDQMQALLRRRIPMPASVLEEGVLEVVFRGDREEYDKAAEEGRLDAIAEISFYNNMRAYDEFLEDLVFDLDALIADLDAIIVTPLRESQELFEQHPYMTRLYTTLSAEEMTIDPAFSFNPDLPEVSNLRRADARFECVDFDPDNPDYEKLVLVVTLADGREIRSLPFAELPPPDDRILPAAAVIERLDESGPPVVLQRMTAVEESGEASTLPADFVLWPNRPNPFNAATIISFHVPTELEDASLAIYNLLGQPVRTSLLRPGTVGYGEVGWDGLDDIGRQMGSGVYIARLEGRNGSLSRRLLLLR